MGAQDGGAICWFLKSLFSPAGGTDGPFLLNWDVPGVFKCGSDTDFDFELIKIANTSHH